MDPDGNPYIAPDNMIHIVCFMLSLPTDAQQVNLKPYTTKPPVSISFQIPYSICFSIPNVFPIVFSLFRNEAVTPQVSTLWMKGAIRFRV